MKPKVDKVEKIAERVLRDLERDMFKDDSNVLLPVKPPLWLTICTVADLKLLAQHALRKGKPR